MKITTLNAYDSLLFMLGHNTMKWNHAALIIDKKGNLISKGYNIQRKSITLYRYGYKRPYHHAESHAIAKAATPLIGTTLIVIRLSKGKTKLSNSKPCNHCISLIKETGIRHVYYTDKRGLLQSMRL